MCGISGVAIFTEEIVDQHKLKCMADSLAHRGPDGAAFWINQSNKIGFGHRRLSIIDLSDLGRQPMHYLNGRYTIVFNGEIYNYIELKSILIKEGYQFQSHSDTEVLLAMYDWKKEHCLNELDGMFSFAIWDNIAKSLFCARDRFGEKPFFYNYNDGRFIFASEIKGLRVYLEKLVPDFQLLQSHIFSGIKINNNETCFSEIKVLPAAHFIICSAEGLKVKRYWDINLNNEIKLKDVKEYTEEFQRLFRKSINRRLRSDVPYGSSLSGGLDSSAIVCFINDMAEGNFKTFSARFHGAKDEGSWIEKVLKKTGVRNYTVYPEPENMIDELPLLIKHHEYPVGSASIYAQWCVMKLVNEHHVKVLLDGQGADEYLAGYHELKYFAIWQFYRMGMFGRFFHEKKLFNKYYGDNSSMGNAFLLDPLLLLFGYKRPVFKNGLNLKEQLKYYTLNNLSELLRYADRNAMAHSVETRLPFLSHELVQFVFDLPVDLIYRDGKTKYILREAAKNLLPVEIYNRTDKIGFEPPQQKWMQLPEVQIKVQQMNEVLQNNNLIPGDDNFRNMVTGELLNQFTSS